MFVNPVNTLNSYNSLSPIKQILYLIKKSYKSNHFDFTLVFVYAKNS